MLNTTKQFISEMDECKKFIIARVASDMFDDMNEDELAMIKKLFKMTQTAGEVMLKQAEMLDAMNDKLNRMLAKTES